MIKKEDAHRFSMMTKRKLKDFNLIEAQGWVINTSIRIEDDMNEIIFKYFKPQNEDIFRQILLNSTVTSVGGKIKVLNSIGIDNKTIDNLRKITSIRNAFAHTNITHQMNMELDKGSVKGTWTTDILSVMNSSGELKTKGAMVYLKEFLELWKIIEPVLDDWKKQLSGENKKSPSKKAR